MTKKKTEILNSIEIAKNIFTLEAQAINNLKELLTEDFDRVIQLVKHSKGRLVITGMGKSGHIGKKIAATLASTGTPSFFMHPAEAIHGDLGMLTSDDILLAISNSGESEEIIRIIPIVKKMNVPLIAMTGKPDSTLAKESNYLLNISIEKEACPLQLAPMASTTVTLAMGDALAAALMKARNFKPENFAFFHPGGSLGKRLLSKVKDVMRKDNLPIVDEEDTFQTVIQIITEGRLGLCIVKLKNDKYGIITDGDLRRVLQNSKSTRFDIKAKEIMTKEPLSIDSKEMLSEAEALMYDNKVKELLVLENNKFVGVLQLYDIGKL